MLQGRLSLTHLKGYCAFLLENHLEDFAAKDLRRNRELDLPLLKLFAHLSEQELLEMSKKSISEYFLNILEGKVVEVVQKSMEDWKTDQLKGVRRNEIKAADIVLIYNARKHTFVQFVTNYTTDPEEIVAIVNELEDFYTFQSNLAIETFAEIKQAQLLENKNRLKDAQRIANIGNWEYNMTTKRSYWSDQLYSIYGLNKEHFPNGISSEVLREFISDEETEKFRTKTNEAVANLGRYHHEFEMRRADGIKRILRDEGYAEKNQKGDVVLKGITQDITERKHMEDQLIQREHFIRHVVDSTPDIIYVYDVIENTYPYLNKEFGSILGYENDLFKKEATFLMQDIVHQEDLPILMARRKSYDTLKDGEVMEDEIRIKNAENNWTWLNIRGMAFKRNADGKLQQIIATARDVTKEKKHQSQLIELNRELNSRNEELAVIQEELQATNEELYQSNLHLEERVQQRTIELTKSANETKASAERIKLILESIPPMAWTALPNGDVNYFSKRWYDYTGLEPEASFFDGWQKVIHPEDLGTVLRVWSQSMLEGTPVEMENRFQKADGSYRWHLVRAFPLLDQEGRTSLWVGTCTDIHDIKNLSKQLKDNETQLRLITDNIPAYVSYVDRHCRYVYVNAQYGDFGMHPDLVEGKTIEEVLGKKNFENSLPNIKRVLNGEMVAFDNKIVMKNGAIKHLDVKYVPDFDADAKVKGFVVLGVDMTERIEIEKSLEEKNATLLRINSDLDTFVYTASHDLKSPVSNIEGLVNTVTELLTEESKQNAEVQMIFEMIHTSISRFKNTINKLTEVSKLQNIDEDDVKEVDVDSVIETVKILTKDLLEQSKAVIKTNTSECCSIKFSEKNLQSIVYNLLNNAIKYRSPNRQPIVQINCFLRDEVVVLEVTDNGLGIAPQHLTAIFKMFKRAHHHVEGSGVGLYLVKRIVDNAGGKIEVESEVDKGTTFRLFFPQM